MDAGGWRELEEYYLRGNESCDLLKVFLVDDESIVISDLSTLIDWKAGGFEIVGWANSAEQALKQIPQKNPDLIFMDVSLPTMDGLELSEQLRKMLPNITIIILSGYRDFSYAQRAINVGVLTYLVKHELTPDKLMITLDKVKEKYREKACQATLLRRQVVSDLCAGKVEWGELQADRKTFLSAYEKKRFICALITQFHPLFQPLKEFSYQVVQHVAEYPRNSGATVLDLVPVEENLLLTVDVSNLKRSAGESEKLVRGLLQNVTDLITDEKKHFFASYLVREGSPDRLALDYQILKESVKSAIFYGYSKVISAESINTGKIKELDLSFLRPAVFSRDFDAFAKQLSECFDRIIEVRDYWAYMECITRVRLFTDNLPENRIWEEIVESKAENAREAADHIIKKLREYHKGFSGNQKYSAMTNFIIKYIRENYDRSPTLQEAADALKSNNMYVGQRFKKETGKGFHDYLAEYRIKLAQDMLANTNMKIFEIAEKTGIKNSQYFSQVFKDITGLTPVEYRNRYYQA